MSFVASSTPRFPRTWDVVPFEEAVLDATGGSPRLQTHEYRLSGRLPIIDQGKAHVAGWTDDLTMVCRAPLPCIVFGDHTCALKLVDRPFAIGADGVKVLIARKSLEPRFLYQYLRTVRLPKDLGYSRHFKYLKEAKIPMPPKEEQLRIANTLERADAIRRKRKEAIALTEELLRSAFLEMFGDPVTNPKGWQTLGIESVCEVIVDCVNRTAPVVGHETPYKMIRTTNVKGGKVLLDDVNFVTRETFELWNRRCTPKRNDVLLTREAPVGEAGLLLADDHVFLGQRLMLYRPHPEKLLSEYLVQAFLGRHMRSQFDAHGSGSTVKHLSLPICRSLSVRVPPLDLQERFAGLSRLVNASLVRHQKARHQTDALFASLVHRAFRGDVSVTTGVVKPKLELVDAGSR